MREKRADIRGIAGLRERKSIASDERIVLCIVFLFLIVLIAAVSMLQSSRIRFLERRILALEKGSAIVASDLIGKEGKDRQESPAIPAH